MDFDKFQVKKRADIFRGIIRDRERFQLEFDHAGVQWLDGFIIYLRGRNYDPALQEIAGCYFGECIRHTFGGEWSLHQEYGLMITISECLRLFPLNKTSKHFESGEGDSVLGMFQTIPVMLPNLLVELVEQTPTELVVTHTPQIVYAKRNGLNSGREFTWEYKTSVTSNVDSTVKEFGAFSWDGNAWIFSNVGGKLFRTTEFSDWYSCPRGELIAGQTYSDPNNWSASDQLHQSKAKWFYIAKTSSGRLIKGEAIVEKMADTI